MSITQPDITQLPFLKALCWQCNPEALTPAERLATYERGWRHRGVLAEPSQVEIQYIKDLAEQYHSWIGSHV